MQSKRFVVRKSLIGKNSRIEQWYSVRIMKDKLEEMACFSKV